MNLTTRLLAAGAAAATLTGLVAAPAAAERAAYPDPADMGGASLNDIRRVTVDHGSIRSTVRVRMTDLRRHSGGGPAGLTVRLDTRRDRPGPEYRVTTGLYEGTDYQLMKVEDHRVVGQPMTCDHSVHLGFGRDVVRFRTSNRCIVTPHRIRVSVRMTDEYDGSHPVTDWLGAPRSWTDWLRAA